MASSNRIGARNRDDLPDLTEIYFFRLRNRDFVTGNGGLAPRQSPIRRRLSEFALLLCLLVLAATAVTAVAEPSLADKRLASFAVIPLLAAVCLVFAVRDQRRRARLDARLAKDGRLLPGTLTSCRFVRARKENTGSLAPGASLAIRYRFTAPDGQPFEKHETVEYLPADLKTLPPAGTKILTLFIDREACTAL
jgi:hypothetical protein